MYQLASEMDFDQMATMLDALQSALVKDVPSSINFALLLDFKCKILDCCLKLWPLERFRDILYILHPIECICMALLWDDHMTLRVHTRLSYVQT
jgi:hypothetical protein